MLTGEKGFEGVLHNERDSLWAVKRGTAQWASWVFWYKNEFGKSFFPDWLTVLYEWPPTTQSGADAVAQWISDIRDGKFRAEIMPIGGARVPRHPHPWSGGKVAA